MKPPTDDEIIDFLRALYSEGIDTNLNLDSQKTEDRYTNGMMMTVNKDSDYISQGATNELIADLIRKHQNKLVDEVSSNDEYLNTKGGIENLAKEGTTREEAINKNPMIVKAIIQNAFGNAVAHAKYILADNIIGVEKNDKAFRELHNSSNALRNYGKIIRGAIKGYNNKLQDLQEETQNVFDMIWSGITLPIPDKAEPIVKVAEIAIKNKIKNAEAFKDENLTYEKLQEDFNKIIGGLGDSISSYSLVDGSSLNDDAERLIESFEVPPRE
jgi:hypothetical protein